MRGFVPLAGVAAVTVVATSLARPAHAQDRVDPIPTGPEVVVEALSPFRGDPDSSRVASILDEANRERAFPASDYDRVLVARLWRRAGEADLSARFLEAIPDDSDAIGLAAYETARLLLQTGQATEAGSRAFWTACASEDPSTRAEIAWDLLPVTIPGERDEWASLTAGDATCAWLREFWDERARRMAVSRDQRIAIHFQRLTRARHEMWIKRLRFYREVTDEHGRPPGLAVDDRGLMLIRMGDPEAREVCPGRNADLLAECWAYYRPAGYRLYQFSQYKKAAGEVVPDGDYSLDEGVPYRAPGDGWYHKYFLNGDIPETAKTAVLRVGRASLTVDRFLDEIEATLDGAEFGARAGRPLVLATRRYTDDALLGIPDVPAIESRVRMRFEALRFLNPSSSSWQVWMLASARAGDLEPSSKEGDATLNPAGRVAVSSSERGVSLIDLAGRPVDARKLGADAGIPLRGVLTATPGPLPLTLVIEDQNAPGTGAWLQDTINVPAVGGLPQVSDIAVAQAEGGTWTRDGETFLQISPAHNTNADGSIHTYFEVYGVRPGSGYEVELRLAPADVADRIWRLDEGDLAFRLQFASEMPGQIGRHHLRLDLGDTEPGEYTLALRIQDEASGAYSLPALTDVFVAER